MNNSLTKLALERVKPSEEEIKDIEISLKDFSSKFKEELKVLKIDAELFIGGSFAKKTLIKKSNYDVDIFIRFKDDLKASDFVEKVLKKLKVNFKRVHGSRDYFMVKIKDNLIFEIVPVFKINKTKESKNITDLSYLHVSYVNKKVKDKKILDEILLAKSFCYNSGCYGAESYINGFSGYALELLVINYKGFMNFVKAIAKHKEGKILIDIEKQYKNKKDILRDINSSKLKSPIILIDPTMDKRNALAALSEETFSKFKLVCKEFLKNPSLKFFETKKTDLNAIKQKAVKNKEEFIHLKLSTEKQEGDIAGSKLFKFYHFLEKEINKYFNIVEKGFAYGGGKEAKVYFVVKNKKELIIKGPEINDSKSVLMFKKAHKNNFTKSKRVYAKEKVNFSASSFISNWKIKYRKIVSDMDISNIEVIL